MNCLVLKPKVFIIIKNTLLKSDSAVARYLGLCSCNTLKVGEGDYGAWSPYTP